MKWIKKFENFINDDSREASSTDFVSSYNSDINNRAKQFVDNLTPADLLNLFKSKFEINAEGLTPDEFNKLEDELREKAVKYFIDNPSEMTKYEPGAALKPTGDGIPRMYGNVGGSSHANSIRIGE
jgi:hypothetical protein